MRESVEDMGRIGSGFDRFNPCDEALARFLQVYYSEKHQDFMEKYVYPFSFFNR